MFHQEKKNVCVSVQSLYLWFKIEKTAETYGDIINRRDQFYDNIGQIDQSRKHGAEEDNA